jgi:hypothetical protein
VNESDDSVSNDRGDRASDKGFVVIGVKETTIAHEEVGNTNCKRSATGGTQVEPCVKNLRSKGIHMFWCRCNERLNAAAGVRQD